MAESEGLLLLSPIVSTQAHYVRSSVSGMALLGNILSPIPCNVAHDEGDNEDNHHTGEPSSCRTTKRDILQSRIFDNVLELNSESKRIERVIVETVDEHSVGSIDRESKISFFMSKEKQSDDLQQDNQSSERGNDQHSPLPCSENTQPNPLSDKTVTVELGDTNDLSAEDRSSLRIDEKGHKNRDDEECSGVGCCVMANDVCITKDTTTNAQDSLEWEIESNDQIASQDNETNLPGAVQLNDSFASTGSNREEEIQQAQDALGATSVVFMDRLRGASLRRKMNLARSRDSLVNKEKAQREAIAASEAAKSSGACQSDPSNQNISKDSSDINHFKARPLSKSILKSGGISGVRFIEKRPITTPCSPLLGSRRENRQSIEQTTTTMKNISCIDEVELCVFKALPWPRNKVENAGTYGVPKVEKRPTTVPESPLLGHRRRKQDSRVNEKKKDTPVRPILKTPPLSSKENEMLLNEADTIHVDGYIPHSTRRASQRAEYDLRRQEREERRRIRKRRESLAQIKALREELNVLLNKI